MSTLPNETRAPSREPDDGPEPPPRGVRAMGVARWLLVFLAASAAVWTWASYVGGQRAHADPMSRQKSTTRYQCPMHPQIVSDEPGECPICHMTLRPMAAEQGSSSPALEPASAIPQTGRVTSRPPAPDAGRTAAAGRAARDPAASPPGSVPPDRTPITLTFDWVQSIGVRTALAEERDTGGTLRVSATVAAAEQGAAEVHVRAPGFVERIAVRETGVRVGAGQELLGLYSPDVFQAESELLAAKGFGEQGARTVEAVRQRLDLLGVSSPTIEEVLASGKAMRVIPIASPTSGFVSKKNVVLGSYVTPEVALYEIVDLSQVYIVADVSQRDIASIHVGTEGRFTPAQQPDTVVSAKVDLLYPQLNAEARTTRARMQVKNDKLRLRPGQYGQVDFVLAPSKIVVIPRDALVDAGRLTYVFVDQGGGRYAPSVVAIGKELDDDIEVIAGVSAGDRVVSSATFLIDSESRLRASLSHAAGGAAP